MPTDIFFDPLTQSYWLTQNDELIAGPYTTRAEAVEALSCEDDA